MLPVQHPPAKPPHLRRQRGTRPRSNDPAFRLDEAMATLQDRRAHLIRAGQRRLIARALTGATVSTDDIRDLETGPVRRHFAGAVPRRLHALGILQPIGYQPSAVPGSHARPILHWRLADRAAAELWLQEHPELSPVPPTQQLLPMGGDE